jgi:hypothetical protein
LPSPIQHRSFSTFAANLQWGTRDHSFASSSPFFFPCPSQSDFGKQNPTQKKTEKKKKEKTPEKPQTGFETFWE